MLKTIYRTRVPATDLILVDRVYGFATEARLQSYLDRFPHAEVLPPVELTGQQQSQWMSTGSWEEHWERGRFLSGGQLLRWPEDRLEINPITPVIRAELFARAAEADDRDRFVLDYISVYTPEWVVQHPEYWGDDSGLRDQLKQLWRAAHYSVGEICQFAALSMMQLSQMSLTPYRTLQRWAGDDEKFSPRERYYLLTLTGLLPDL